MTKTPDWTVASYLSASRIILTIPVGVLLFTEGDTNRYWAVGLIVLGVATDFLDGHMARRMHQVSEIGKIIDPLADKIAVGALALFLALLGDIPFWFLGAVVARDGLIVAGGIYIRKRKRVVTQSNMLGKVAVNFIALYLFLALLGLEDLQRVEDVILAMSVFLMVVSLGVYAKRLLVGKKGTA